MTLRQMIAQQMTRQRVTFVDLARKMGKNADWLRTYVRGLDTARRYQLFPLANLSRALGKSSNWLLDELIERGMWK